MLSFPAKLDSAVQEPITITNWLVLFEDEEGGVRKNPGRRSTGLHGTRIVLPVLYAVIYTSIKYNILPFLPQIFTCNVG